MRTSKSSDSSAAAVSSGPPSGALISDTILVSPEKVILLRKIQATCRHTRRPVPDSVDGFMRFLLTTLVDVDLFKKKRWTGKIKAQELIKSEVWSIENCLATVSYNDRKIVDCWLLIVSVESWFNTHSLSTRNFEKRSWVSSELVWIKLHVKPKEPTTKSLSIKIYHLFHLISSIVSVYVVYILPLYQDCYRDVLANLRTSVRMRPDWGADSGIPFEAETADRRTIHRRHS